MDEPEGFVVEDGRGIYRPVGAMSLDEAVELVTAAITAARKQGAEDLLVNTVGVTGFSSPDMVERFYLAVQWAAAARGMLRLAVVAQPEMIHPTKFGVLVAANRGLTSDVFTEEPEAVAWLDIVRRTKR